MMRRMPSHPHRPPLPESPIASAGPSRRALLQAGAALPLLAAAGGTHASLANAETLAALRRGGVVLVFRHALAPGTFDPPQFRLGDCSTQRNLSAEGRAQAQRMGQWFQQQGLQAARVRSSPWCRCVDTATLAFGKAEAWAALGSPRGYNEATNEDHLRQLRTALNEAAAAPGRFEVWVTHMFVLSALLRESASSGEGLLLRSDGRGGAQVLGRIAPA